MVVVTAVPWFTKSAGATATAAPMPVPVTTAAAVATVDSQPIEVHVLPTSQPIESHLWRGQAEEERSFQILGTLQQLQQPYTK